MSYSIPFFDYKAFTSDPSLPPLIDEVLKSGYLIGGPFVSQLEEEIQAYTGIKRCVAVGNATDALEIIFKFLDLPPSKVLVPSHTMIASASAFISLNLEPLIVDVDPASGVLSLEILKNSNLDNVSACVVTQLNGICADMPAISQFLSERNIILVEDSAQGIGSFHGETHSGGFGAAGCISFYPAKVLGCLGDGGAIITNDNLLADFALAYRDHGRSSTLEPSLWGRNSRLDSLNARILLHKLTMLSDYIAHRRSIAAVYYDGLADLVGLHIVGMPPKCSINSTAESTFQNFEIRATRRDQLREYLAYHGIGTIIQWGGFSLAHLSRLGLSISDYPITQKLFEQLLLLPMNHMLALSSAHQIVDCIRSFYLD